MTGWLVAGVALAAALGVVLYSRWRTARLLARLDEMLTAAIDGSFAERHFDESRLSALESRLAQYLAASVLSARSLRTQKDQISALISDISHQTRTPVANLQLYAQLLAEQPLTPRDSAAHRPLPPSPKTANPHGSVGKVFPVGNRYPVPSPGAGAAGSHGGTGCGTVSPKGKGRADPAVNRSNAGQRLL